MRRPTTQSAWHRASIVLLAFSVGLASVAACKPHSGPQLDSNGSDPPDGGGPLGKLYANDPALMVWTQYGQPDRLVLGYTDESGLYDADEIAHRLVPKARQSAAGVSFSVDHGKSWTRVGPLAPSPAGCGPGPCAVALAGPPALAPVETFSSTNYVTLAYTRTDLAVPDAIASMSTRDLVHWDPPRIAVYLPGRSPSRPSLARRNATSVIAFTDREQGVLFLASSDYDPPSFRIEQPAVGSLIDDDAYKDRPIVRLSTITEGHVAYIIPRSEDGSAFDLRMLHIFRTVDMLGNVTPWTASTIFAVNKVTIDPTLTGALGRAWRDAYPFSFEVGDGGKHLYLAYRQRSTSTGESAIFLVDCDATDGGNCAIEDTGQLTAGWRVRHFPVPAYGGGQFVPVLAADRYSTAASLAWLQEVGPANGSFTLMGIKTKNSGDTLTAPTDLRAGQGGPWKPCPTASSIAANVHSYGERSASAIVPWDSTAGTEPTLITAHSDSTYGCEDLGELTFDQHVGVATW